MKFEVGDELKSCNDTEKVENISVDTTETR